jgi:hypothetical protein
MMSKNDSLYINLSPEIEMNIIVRVRWLLNDIQYFHGQFRHHLLSKKLLQICQQNTYMYNPTSK